MVHYIRFLSPPQTTETQKKLFSVSAVVAITTDLGDAFFPEDVDLLVRVVATGTQAKTLSEHKASWKGSSRALKVAIQCSGKYATHHVRVHMAATDSSGTLPSLKILDVWSMPFELANQQRAEPLVDRELIFSETANLKIREETGDSIARHIWDASFGFLIHLQRTLNESSTCIKTQKLINKGKDKRLRILELGAGCGIVGIAYATTLKADVLLTDLEDAMKILATNIKLASPDAKSSLRAEILDWSSDVHDSLNAKYDLILVSDCIYNPDSSVQLVETLQRLARGSPKALILVGFKRRHEADDVFFESMKAAKFDVLETETIAPPHIMSDYDTTSPTIEFYTYQFPT